MRRPFAQRMRDSGDGFRKRQIDVLLVNMGRLCNQACLHCHVEAGPGRKEIMGRETVEAILRFVEVSGIPIVDITGGAPELNPNFEYLVVKSCVLLERHVINRCNLTVIFEPGQDYLPEFFRENRIELICSLPCYLEENVDRQRGDGTFELSIRALQMLNRLGYGVPGTGLDLHLVYNPLGAYLPPPQEQLEVDYKRVLQEKYGIVFNRLYCLTNVPITRFEKFLKLRGEHDQYMHLLESAFNPATLDRVMCRNVLSVGWEGSVYDCDFNQALRMPLRDGEGKPLKIWELDADSVEGRQILVGNHCYACTAGTGSSCGGAILA
ncbi:MAG: radical SAM protein [Candidatus Methylomirabilota bacterium]|nr:radical SAM/Cys-rich domain protein [candidate division NC10 bacterium]PWB46081.1 MAG: radical SAM protein [candidate division NC10 bacterium]